jgi:hypothetical protein
MSQSDNFIRSNQATPEQLRARLELRRSNAAVPHKNKKAYTRKKKHKKVSDPNDSI